MATDPELLLTVNGVDVTPYVWDWGTLRLTDSWDQNPTLTVEIRCTFTEAASLSVPAFADVRLVNLITGEVLFEGVQASDLSQRTEDPHWIVTPISATGYQSLFDATPVTVGVTLPHAVFFLDVMQIISDMVRTSFADYRVNTTPVLWPYNAVSWPEVSYWWLNGATDLVISPGTMLSSALASILELTCPYEPGFGSINDVFGYRAKLFPGIGLAISRPDDSLRGASSAFLRYDERPAGISLSRNDGSVSSGAVETLSDGSARVVRGDTSQTNGYVVSRATYDGSWIGSLYTPDMIDAQVVEFVLGPYAAASGYTFTTAAIPDDILVGQVVTLEHPYWGTVNAKVQSVSTAFRSGLDKSSTGLPYFLNSGRTLDSGWSLDATATSGVERHRRVHTGTVSFIPRTFLGSARRYGLGIHG